MESLKLKDIIYYYTEIDCHHQQNHRKCVVYFRILSYGLLFVCMNMEIPIFLLLIKCQFVKDTVQQLQFVSNGNNFQSIWESWHV